MSLSANANQYTRDTGVVTFTAPKSSEYQWYVNRGTKWQKLTGKTARTLTITARKSMHGYRYRCRIKGKWTKAERLYITDMNAKYWRDIVPIGGMFYPKCADGYCYIHAPDCADEAKDAIRRINKQIGRTYIYTDSPHIADIVILEWHGTHLPDSMWLTGGEIPEIRQHGSEWVGVTFSDNGLHYLICINAALEADPEYQVAVIMHELGHCLGLGHSTYHKSIMYESADKPYMTKRDIADFKRQRKLLKHLTLA